MKFTFCKLIVLFLTHDQTEEKEEIEIPSPQDSRFEMLELVLLTLRFPSGTAELLPVKWTIRNDTGGCHFSAKCGTLSAGDDGIHLYNFSLSFSQSFFFTRIRDECFKRKSCGL